MLKCLEYCISFWVFAMLHNIFSNIQRKGCNAIIRKIFQNLINMTESPVEGKKIDIKGQVNNWEVCQYATENSIPNLNWSGKKHPNYSYLKWVHISTSHWLGRRRLYAKLSYLIFKSDDEWIIFFFCTFCCSLPIQYTVRHTTTFNCSAFISKLCSYDRMNNRNCTMIS